MGFVQNEQTAASVDIDGDLDAQEEEELNRALALSLSQGSVPIDPALLEEPAVWFLVLMIPSFLIYMHILVNSVYSSTIYYKNCPISPQAHHATHERDVDEKARRPNKTAEEVFIEAWIRYLLHNRLLEKGMFLCHFMMRVS